MSNWLDKLKEYAPSIVTAIATGGATLPQLALKAISDATGLDIKTESEAEKVVNAMSPSQMLEMKKADQSFEIEKQKLENEVLKSVNQTMQKEYDSDDKFVSRWRPFYGYAVASSWFVQMTGFTIMFVWVAINKPSELPVLVQNFAILSGALVSLWGIALAVLGVSVHKRSKDKENKPVK